MKNLVKQLDKLIELPYGLTDFKLRKKDERIHWGRKRSDYHSKNGIFPYDRAKRIINSNIGKSFDMAFSYYCRQVPKYQQKVFLRFFEGARYWGPDYYIDDNGNIQTHIEKKKKIYTIYSSDYKTAFVHKITGDPYPKWYATGKFPNYNDYHHVVISGQSWNFKSKKDPIYAKYHKELRDYKRKLIREEKKQREAKQYSFLTKQEAEVKKAKAHDLVKVISHGFDPVTSFRKDKENGR